MKSFFAALLALTLTTSAFALPNKRLFQDLKLASQQLLEKQTFTNVIAGGQTNYFVAAHAGPTSAAAATISTFLAQPDVPRNLTIVPTGTTGDVESCVITVTGTDYFGRAITEAFTFSANASTQQVGNKAFKTISSAAFAADCESGGFAATWNIGTGEKIGLKRCMDGNHLAFTTIDGAYETTRATVAYDEDEVSKNTLDFNGTMNGSSDFEAFFIQDFNSSCQP